MLETFITFLGYYSFICLTLWVYSWFHGYQDLKDNKLEERK